MSVGTLLMTACVCSKAQFGPNTDACDTICNQIELNS